MPTTRFTPIARRSTDVDPPAAAEHAYARIGRSWRAPVPCATFNDTEPEPSPFVLAAADSKRALLLTSSIIALALVVAVVFVVLSIWPGKS